MKALATKTKNRVTKIPLLALRTRVVMEIGNVSAQETKIITAQTKRIH